MNVHKAQITVMKMQLVPILLEDLHVHAMRVTLEVVSLVKVSYFTLYYNDNAKFHTCWVRST